jgi:hypothetical protein
MSSKDLNTSVSRIEKYRCSGCGGQMDITIPHRHPLSIILHCCNRYCERFGQEVRVNCCSNILVS